MVRLKMHSFNDYWPDRNYIEGEPYIDCYNDCFCLYDPIEPYSIALMLEPRSIDPQGYEFVDKHPGKFAYIFTHDAELLKNENARFYNWAWVWGTADVPKTKGISFISSDKELCELHTRRLRLAKEYDGSGKVDCFGTFKGVKNWTNTYDSHAEYRFAIVIENGISDYWFTEKIVNCFSNKTVPIYLGANKIDEFFNPAGIIQVRDEIEIRSVVDRLNESEERMRRVYNRMRPAIDDNFERAKDYTVHWRDRFWIQFEGILNDLCNAKQGSGLS